MKQTINFSQFCDAFANMGRQGQFTYEAKKILFDYFQQYEESTGEEIELDVIDICCDYNEDTIKEILDDYYSEKKKKDILELSLDEQKEKIETFLGERTTFCGWTSENGENNAVYAVF